MADSQRIIIIFFFTFAQEWRSEMHGYTSVMQQRVKEKGMTYKD